MRSYKIDSPFKYQATPTPGRFEFKPGEKFELTPLPADEPIEIIKDANRALRIGEIDKCDILIAFKDIDEPKPGKIYLRKINNKLAYTAMTSQGKIIKNIILKDELVPHGFPRKLTPDEENALKEKILGNMSQSEYALKKPTLLDCRLEDLRFTSMEKNLYEAPQSTLILMDRTKIFSMMKPMLEKMENNDPHIMLRKMREDLLARLTEGAYITSIQKDKIISKENRELAQKVINSLGQSRIDGMDTETAKQMVQTILQKGKIDKLTLSPHLAKICSRELLLSYKKVITDKIEFTGNTPGLNSFKQFLVTHLLSKAPEEQRDFLANNIARNFHQSGFMAATRSYFQFKFNHQVLSSPPPQGQQQAVIQLSDPREQNFTMSCDQKGNVTFKATTGYTDIATSGIESKAADVRGGASFVEIDSTIQISAVPSSTPGQTHELSLTSEPLTIRKAPLAKNKIRVPFLNTFFSLLCDDPLSGKNGIFLLDHKPSSEEVKEMATYLYFDESNKLKYVVKDFDRPTIEGTVPSNKLDTPCLKELATSNAATDISKIETTNARQKNALITLTKAAKALEEPAPPKKYTGVLGYIQRAWGGESKEKKHTPEQPEKVAAPPSGRRL